MKEKFKKIIDVPDGILNGYYLEIISGKEAVLSGNVEVMELGETVLKIKCNEHAVAFYGEKLKIECYEADRIRVGGVLSEIRFL